MGIAIAIGFVFLVFFIGWGKPQKSRSVIANMNSEYIGQLMGLPTTRTPNHPYYPTSSNVPKHRKTSKKQPKTSKNDRKRSKMHENARKRQNVRNVEKRPKFSSEGHAAPILSRVCGAAAPRPPPRRGRRRCRVGIADLLRASGNPQEAPDTFLTFLRTPLLSAPFTGTKVRKSDQGGRHPSPPPGPPHAPPDDAWGGQGGVAGAAPPG